MIDFVWKYTKKSTYKCPNCGLPRANRFQNSVTGDLADAEFARCNRFDHCGYNRRPNTEAKFCEREPVVLTPFYMPQQSFDETQIDLQKNTLFRYLCSVFHAPEVKRVFARYKVGTSSFGDAIFWQIDQFGLLRSAKKITYFSNGKRNKAYGASWIHTKLNFDPTKQEIRQCLFGEHLLQSGYFPTVYIVESEKTALICEICKRDKHSLFLATGGLQNLGNIAKCKFEDWQTVFLIPDNNGNEIWKEKINRLKLNATIKIIQALQTLDDGADVGDLLINSKLNKTKTHAKY